MRCRPCCLPIAAAGATIAVRWRRRSTLDITNEGNLGRSKYMLKLAQAESDFGLKSQHDGTSKKNEPEDELKSQAETL